MRNVPCIRQDCCHCRDQFEGRLGNHLEDEYDEKIETLEAKHLDIENRIEEIDDTTEEIEDEIERLYAKIHRKITLRDQLLGERDGIFDVLHDLENEIGDLIEKGIG